MRALSLLLLAACTVESMPESMPPTDTATADVWPYADIVAIVESCTTRDDLRPLPLYCIDGRIVAPTPIVMPHESACVLVADWVKVQDIPRTGSLDGFTVDHIDRMDWPAVLAPPSGQADCHR